MSFTIHMLRETGASCDLSIVVRDATAAGFSRVATPIGNPLLPESVLRPPDSTLVPVSRMRTENALEDELWKSSVLAELSSVAPLWCRNSKVQSAALDQFKAEILQANHVGCSSLHLRLTKEPHPLLLQSLRQWLDPEASPRIMTNFFVSVPLVNPEKVRSTYVQQTSDIEIEDPWNWWRTFRNGLGNSVMMTQRFAVVLVIPTDLRVPRVIIDRWLGEPLMYFVLRTDSFVLSRDQRLDLNAAHRQLTKRLLTHGAFAMLSGPIPTQHGMEAYVRCIYGIRATNSQADVEDTFTVHNRKFEDALLRLPQPLSDDVTFEEYQRLNEDGHKYVMYKQAFCRALGSLSRKRPNNAGRGPLRIAVLGAGLGSLIDELLSVADNIGQSVVVHAVEKNRLACMTLEHMRDDSGRSISWSGRVDVSCCDCRCWTPPDKLDAIVSDFLGCFGDDQCLTECVRPVEKYLEDWGVVIPSVVTSFLAPVQSLKVYSSIQSYLYPWENKPEHGYQIPWLCNFRSAFSAATASPVHRDVFPCRGSSGGDASAFCWTAELSFRPLADASVHGFVGSFEAILFENAELTNQRKPGVPLNSVTWFSFFFPLSEPLEAKRGEPVTFCVSRKNDGGRMWYEWSTRYRTDEGVAENSCVHNANGTYFSVKLRT